jgi:hypothetical protein
MTAIDLFMMHDTYSAALTATTLLSERLAALDSEEFQAGTEISQGYSELQELKHRLLTEFLPDSTASSQHLESILDQHRSGRLPLEEATLSGLASKLWASGVEHFNAGDLFRTTEYFEGAWRFLEQTHDQLRQHRVLVMCSHCCATCLR